LHMSTNMIMRLQEMYELCMVPVILFLGFCSFSFLILEQARGGQTDGQTVCNA